MAAASLVSQVAARPAVAWALGLGLLLPGGLAARDAVIAEAAKRLEATRDASGRMGFDQVIRYTLGTRG